ncbi:MAG TPA: hypothetical protein DE060_16820 [Lentisphaeria bacterium]|nr:hypothetical protein [Lentisphaeria bacterium]HCG50855.1 hypothetical protein [Lentisphaeria bacterium]
MKSSKTEKPERFSIVFHTPVRGSGYENKKRLRESKSPDFDFRSRSPADISSIPPGAGFSLILSPRKNHFESLPMNPA